MDSADQLSEFASERTTSLINDLGVIDAAMRSAAANETNRDQRERYITIRDISR